MDKPQRRTATLRVAALLAIMFIGATLPTPLYPLYRQAFGFSGITLTLVYAIYVLGNLAALLLCGRLSDQVGRRRAAFPAIAVALAGTLAFALASGTAWLFVARVLSGFATGLAAGATTAWIADLLCGDEAAATVASSANLAGLTLGPLLAGALAQYAPWPLRLAYAVYAVVLLAAAAAAWRAPETVAARRPEARLELRPRLGVPAEVRLRFLAPAFAAFAIFALMGFYAALVPGLLAAGLHRGSPLLSGGVVAGLFFVATLTALMRGRLGGARAMRLGLVLLVPALALLVAAEAWHALVPLIVATLLAGMAAALGYRGSLEAVNAMAPMQQRGEVVSSYLVVCYLGNSLPVIGIGCLAIWTGAFVAHFAFAAVIAVLALAALASGRGRAGQADERARP
jgi:predicted MFS family arabinose efflux permease